jgi:hypothetical protein
MEISFAAELLGAAPAEISSLTELRARLSATYGAASDAALASWIDRLPNPKYLDASPENVQSNVVEILREIAREASISSNVKEIALHYLREHRRNSLELLSSKVRAKSDSLQLLILNRADTRSVPYLTESLWVSEMLRSRCATLLKKL